MITFTAKLTKLQAEFDDYKKQHEATLIELAAAKEQLSKVENFESYASVIDKFNALTGTHEALQTSFKTIKEENEALKSKAIDMEMEVAKRAADIVASQGLPVPVAVEPQKVEGNIIKLPNGFVMRSIK